MNQVNLPMIAVLLREVLAMHGILNQAGIPSEDIFVNYSEGSPLQVMAQQGELKFVIDVGEGPIEQLMSSELFRQAWTEAVVAFNAATQADRQALINRTHAGRQASQFIAMMEAKGFIFKTPPRAN